MSIKSLKIGELLVPRNMVSSRFNLKGAIKSSLSSSNLKNSNTPMINTPQPPPVRPMVNSAVKVQSSPKPTYTPKQIPQYQRIPRASSFGRSGNLPSTDWNTRQNTGLQRVR